MTVTSGPGAPPSRPSPDPAAVRPAAAAANPTAATGPVGVTADEPSMGQLVAQASEHLSTLLRSEIELAKLELRSTVKNAGTGVGMFAAAGIVLVFSLTFGFLALAEGIAAAGLARWLAFLIVFGFQLLVVGALAFVGIRKVKRIKAPERTIATSKETVAYLKNHG